MKDYMTIEEMTEYFDISPQTLAKWRESGLMYIEVNRRIYFDKKDIAEFLETCKKSIYEAV